ncbi:MAG: HEPN domain-containing protein [Chloroflexi bacterium]|nr:HEPN domain-containing protein [Chloroflexota bacterium]
MNAQVTEWIALAEGDLDTARRELRARLRPNYNAACFHSHQCAEKYLKGFMLDHDIPFEKIHDLLKLWMQIKRHFPEFELIQEWLGLLNQYPVATRYPGLHLSREEAKDAVQATHRVRFFIRSRMGLPPE